MMTAGKWFLNFLKKYRGMLALGIIMTLAATVLALVAPHISGLIVDDVIGGQQYELLPQLVAILLGVTAVRSVLRYYYQFVFEVCSQGVLFTMRDKVYRKFMEEDFNFYNKRKTGDLMSRQTGDMDAIRHFIAYIIYQLCENVLMLLFAIIMIFTVNVKLALCMVAILPFTALVTYLQSKYVKPAFKRNRDCFSSLNAFVQENVSGNRVVKAFAKEDFEIEKFNRENDNYMESEIAASRIWMKYLPIFEILSQLLTVVLMAYGGYMVIDGQISLGGLVKINGYLWMLTNPVRNAGWLINDMQRFATSIEKIYDTYSSVPDIRPPKDGVRAKRFNGAIEFDDVTYKADDVDIVENVSFKVEPGQTVGIIGSTGAGKSTLMNLLCRFYDVTDGSVKIDGVNVKDLDLYDLRSNIGMAMQDVFLFSDTIEGNIAYARPDCPFEEVKQAAIKADANHFIQELPDGYDTIVGERGVGLSGGQKQRISLARALLKDPSILILDDTTSAVDMETESYIQKQLKAIQNKCTIFVIAYRISSVCDADQILVMDNGRIVEHGTHDELMKKDGYYAAAFRTQYGEIPDELTEGGE